MIGRNSDFGPLRIKLLLRGLKIRTNPISLTSHQSLFFLSWKKEELDKNLLFGKIWAFGQKRGNCYTERSSTQTSKFNDNVLMELSVIILFSGFFFIFQFFLGWEEN